ncbi:CMP-N-acetylneuraminate-beta-galactosamide-alpha-2,3-sialyltransferase 1-like [Acanthochromis polyacanthus]|uniref:CMP-N-acetylneuraminate-beta-galactosamide- alpha-2,3-sialyltransferase 1-like n=1 Tax=Acanthochromis polyacanthus TaxID=80966 RepID=UPI002234245E|nr:CMP-N-acetylneuraminate-beta-galactosamide-alpha-2,3-sialyltransferase 1-like [Acanthochromis polyacanthus]
MRYKFTTRVFIFLVGITVIPFFFNSLWNFSVYVLSHWELSLCACHKCLKEGDPCLTDLIKESPTPFLSKQYRTSEDDFNWWKDLYGEKCNFTFFSATVDKLFQIFPPVPDVLEPRPDRCRTCAVVGNSVNLKGSHYGPLIDFHDIVIRMNYGRTTGYEADVGTKTTHHVFYPESATSLANTTYLLFFPFKISDFLWLLNKLDPEEDSAVNSKRIANKDLVMILNPAFMRYVHDAWLGQRGYYPSTGFLTFALSLLICDEVNVFGFGADSDGNWNHYYEQHKYKDLKTGAHPGTFEYQTIEKLHKRQMIEFFKGW